jgi:KDO2-lipid IV(A) lauroyltransferase
VLRGERRKALESLATAFPEASDAERSALMHRCFRHLGRVVLELANFAQLDAAGWVDWPAEDRAALDAALAPGKGVVFVTGHVGNWELLARHVARAGYGAWVVGKETSDPRSTALVEDMRAKGSLHTIWRGRPGAVREMLRALKGGHLLGFLIDQDTSVQSVWVPFFGRPAKTPRAAAELALRTGAAPMLGFCVRTPEGRYRIRMQVVDKPNSGDAEADVVALTAALTAGIEAAIRQTPEQWVWMHRRWKSPPEG